MNTYDIETFEENNNVVPYCIAMIIDNKEYSVYYKADSDIIMESINIIVNNSVKPKNMIYIHNINFDGIIIIESLTKNKIKFEMINRELNIYSINIEYCENIIIFKCSYKILPTSLNKLAELSNISKKPFPYKFACRKNLFYIGECPDLKYFNNKNDYENFKENIFDFKKESIHYCMNDVLILKKIIEDVYEIFKEINKNFIFFLKNSNSSPSLSYKLYFKFFNNYNIEKKISIELYEYIKLSYHGGRCEIFGNSDKDEITKYYDFSGMYGQCMMDFFPYGDYEIELNVKNIKKIGFYYIKAESNENYPVLPIKKDGKLFFPNGSINGLFWHEEIELFLENGGILKEIKYGIIFKNKDKIFEIFVKNFNKIRDKGGYYKLLGKLLINSLYGGFGMSEVSSFTYLTFSESEFSEIMEKTDIKSYYKINFCFIIEIIKNHKSNLLFNKENKKWNNNFHDRNIMYASIIASKARIKLFRKITEVLEDGGKLLYCDTDSVFASYKKNNKSKLDWLETYEKSCFILPKFYILKKYDKWESKVKGVANYDLNHEEIIKDFYENKSTLKFENQLNFNKKKYILAQKYNNKILWLNKYDKRLFINNKKDTKPIILDPY